jgi:DnaK suppressor protein
MAGKVRKTTKAKTKAPIKSGTKAAARAAADRKSQKVTQSKAASKPSAAVISKAIAARAVESAKEAPVPEKKPENKRQQELNEKVRKLLLRKRDELIRETKTEIRKYVTGENRQLVETALDEGDLSVVDLSEDISLKQLSTHREILQKIDTAFRKLDEGTYGTCDECGDEIGVERLMIMPFAILCRDCQEERELREKIERENAGL